MCSLLRRRVEMCFLGGMTEEEIADALDVSVRTVSRQQHKARAVLLALLAG